MFARPGEHPVAKRWDLPLCRRIHAACGAHRVSRAIEAYMHRILSAILEPPQAAGQRRSRVPYSSAEPDAIPVITACGRTLNVRLAAPGDAQLLIGLLARLSERS